MFPLVFTISVKSELTGKKGEKTIKVSPNPDTMMDVFYDALCDCLKQIAENNKKVEN